MKKMIFGLEELKAVEDKDFFEIHNGMIHWQGYFNGSVGWAFMEHEGLNTSLHDFVTEYHNNLDEVYSIADSSKDYSLNMGAHQDYDGSIESLNSVVDLLREMLNKATSIKLSDVNEQTPDGFYIVEEEGPLYVKEYELTSVEEDENLPQLPKKIKAHIVGKLEEMPFTVNTWVELDNFFDGEHIIATGKDEEADKRAIMEFLLLYGICQKNGYVHALNA